MQPKHEFSQLSFSYQLSVIKQKKVLPMLLLLLHDIFSLLPAVWSVKPQNQKPIRIKIKTTTSDFSSRANPKASFSDYLQLIPAKMVQYKTIGAEPSCPVVWGLAKTANGLQILVPFWKYFLPDQAKKIELTIFLQGGSLRLERKAF